MDPIKSLEEYCEEIGCGVSFDELAAFPFNHWKQDCEWLVLLINYEQKISTIVPVRARTAEKACVAAVEKYNELVEEYDE